MVNGIKYGVKMSKSDVLALLKEMNREVVFEDSTNEYFLISTTVKID